MNKEEKNQLIEVLDGMLNDNNNFYLADISGLTAEENSSLRRLCYKREVSLQVVKNTLLRRPGGTVHVAASFRCLHFI